MRRIAADFNRSADTHLIRVDLPFRGNIDLYLKDESIHPSGSLKHRLARSLFLYGLCNGQIRPDTTIVEASSGSTAISEAYFARLLDLEFVAVIPDQTSCRKIQQIEFYGARCVRVEAQDIYSEAEAMAQRSGGYYMDQFAQASAVTDWRGNNNIAESLFAQMEQERFSVPTWVVVGAGTGGTSATIGRYIRFRSERLVHTRLCVADPDHSVFFPYFRDRDASLRLETSSRIEGIGRPRVEPSFVPEVVDGMMQVPDAASVATMGWLEGILGRKCGPSTGTNVYACLQLMRRMALHHQPGSVVSLLCDSGDRYAETFYNPEWLATQGWDLEPYRAELKSLERGWKKSDLGVCSTTWAPAGHSENQAGQ